MTGHDERLWMALEAEFPAARRLRQELHRHPDLSGDESATLARAVQALGLPSTSVAGTGATVRVGGPGASVAIRAELDALAIDEHTVVPWRSQVPSMMHACGHDVHLAALVAVGRAIHRVPGGTPVTLLMQPREETYPSGAKDMVAAGVLAANGCAAVLGVHVHPGLQPGSVACVPGAVNASADEFTIEVAGRAGHAAYPHLTRDPVVAMAHVVVALQSIVSRSVDPMTPTVLGVSSLWAGRAPNAIPGSAVATGTIRALGEETRGLLHTRIRDVAESVANAYGCSATVEVTPGEPVLRNDPVLTSAVATALGDNGFEVSATLQSMGADDFSYFGEAAPVVMVFVGTETDVSLHSGDFLPSDADLRAVARAMMAGYLSISASVEGRFADDLALADGVTDA